MTGSPTPSYVLSRWLFVRLLGVVVMGAALSYGVQAEALNGEDGILPAGQWLERVERAAEDRGWDALDRWEVAPTLMWLDRSDGALMGLLWATGLAGLAMFLGLFPGLACLVALVSYLSVVAVGGIFMRYQWDMLLLETLAAGLFLCPWRLEVKPRWDRAASRAGLWVVRLLALKLMVLSGAVKLLSEDPTWADMTALNFHYWTQPIPSWTAWYVHHLGDTFHQVSVVLMFAGEMALPWTMFGPRRLRLAGAWGMVLLILGMGATGNYGYFHALTLVLFVPLLDDDHLGALLPSALTRGRASGEAPRPGSLWVRVVVGSLAVMVIFLSVAQAAQRVGRPLELPEWVATLQDKAGSLRVVNSYGLFATMTTTRPEILLEGSRDGEIWEPYLFPYKAVELHVPPAFAPPLHMPRVDWQLWFAGLRGRCQNTRWFLPFVRELLEGNPAVLELVQQNPFPDEPPRYIRSRLFHYEFTSPEQREVTGDWWRRSEQRDFCPTLELRGDEVVRARSVGR